MNFVAFTDPPTNAPSWR